MAIKPLNSVGGFSVGLPAKNIIDSNGNITTTSANLTGNLSAGAGNLSFDSTTRILTVLGEIVSTNANLGNLVTANYFAGVLTTAGQPNITSVGTLASLSVAGTATVGNVATGGTISAGGNVQVANLSTGGAVEAATVSASGSITGASLSTTGATTTGSLTVSGLSSLGNVGNVAITGGTSGYVLKTDGLGNLSWTDPTAAGVAGSNTQVQFNNAGSFGSSADFTFDRGTNTLAASFFAGTLTTATQPNITSVGDLTSLVVTGTANVGNLETTGYVSASGNIQGGNLSTAGQVQSATVSASGNVQGGNLSTAGQVQSATVSASGNVQGGNLSTAGLISAGTASVSGNANIGNIDTGAISATGNISAANFIGNLYGNFYGNVDAAGSNTQVQFAGANDQLDASAGFTFDKASNAMAVSGTATVGNLSTGGTVSATGTATVGNLSTGGTVSATGTATVGNLTTTGLITGGNVTTTGAVSAGTLTVSGVSSLGNVGNVGITGGTTGQFLQTDGLGNLSFATVGTAGIANGTSNVDIPVASGNVNTSVGGVANVFVVTATGANVTGTINSTGTGTFGNVSTAGLITGGNVTTAGEVATGTLSTSGNASVGGNLSTTGNITVGTGSGGTISGANLVSANFITGTLTTAVQPNITSVGSLTSLSVVGTATVGNLETAGFVSATGNVTGNYIIGNGSLLSNVAASTAITVTANAQPNITSVGNLTSLVVTGTANVGNLETTGFVSATGTATVGNLSTGGTVSATGTGTFGNISTGGTVNATGNIQGGNLSTAGSVTTAILSVTGNASVGNLSTGAISATGSITADAGLISNNLTAFANTAVTVSAGVSGDGLDHNVILVPTGANGAVSASAARIVNVGSPILDTDAATKKYVDDFAQGLNVHDAAQAATPGNLSVITGGTVSYNNGASGVGATLTTAGGTFDIIDGVNVQSTTTRILVKNEANAVWNGIYTWSNATVITRALDYNSVPEVEAGDFIFVSGGTLYDNTGWVQVSSPAAIGGPTDFIDFTQFSGAGTYTANTSAGLILDGSQFNAKVDANSNPTIGFDSNGNLHVPSNARFITPNIDAATGTSLSVTGNITAAEFSGPLTNGTSNVYIPTTNGNVNITANGATSLVVTGTGANVVGNLGVTGNVSATNFIGNFIGNISGNITIPGANTAVVFNDDGYANTSSAFTFNKDTNVVTVSSVLAVTANTQITGGTVTTSSTTLTTIAKFPVAGITGVEYIVKGIDAGNAYSMATVQAITDGTDVDYSIFGTLALGSATYSNLTVVLVDAGSNIALRVNPATSSSTVWTTQYRLI